MSRLTSLLGLAACLLAALPGPTAAQFRQDEADRVLRSLDRPQVERPSVETPNLRPKSQIKTPDRAIEDGVRIGVKRIDIVGATAIAPQTLADLAAPLTGREVSLAELQDLADRLTGLYRDQGYFLSQAVLPAQEIVDGVVRLQVMEGYVSRVVVEGGGKRHQDRIQTFARTIESRQPLDYPSLERFLLLMRDVPGLSAETILRPSPDRFGAAELVVQTGQSLVKGNVEIDNRGTQYLGPRRLTGRINLDGLLGASERTSITVVTTDHVDTRRELRFGSLQQEWYLGDDGMKLIGSVSRTRARLGGSLGPSNIETEASSGRIGLQHATVRRRGESLNTTLTFEGRTSETAIADSKTWEDRLRAVRLGAAWQMAELSGRRHSLTAEYSIGLPVFNASDSFSETNSRTGADYQFRKLELRYGLVQSLWSGFLNLQTQAVYSAARLPASEQVSFGGDGMGLAYDAGEIGGDRGLGAHLELGHSLPGDWDRGETAEGFVFYDAASTWQTDTGLRQSLVSAGLGMRLIMDGISLDGTLARPLTRPVASRLDDGPKDWRLFLKLGWQF